MAEIASGHHGFFVEGVSVQAICGAIKGHKSDSNGLVGVGVLITKASRHFFNAKKIAEAIDTIPNVQAAFDFVGWKAKAEILHVAVA